jgi:hypothetical protein
VESKTRKWVVKGSERRRRRSSMNRLDTIRNSGTTSHCHGMQFVANFTGGRLQLLSLPRAKEQKAYREIPGLLHCTVNLHNTAHSLAAER